MSKKMMVNATHPEENRVAIVEDGILTELDIEVAGREPSKGNIYKAVVVRVETGLQAAFVDYGAERLGFLQIDEINYTTVKPDYKPAEDGRRPRINELLQRGQELLVQITKEERGTKGAALTTYLSLAGRYMVLMPGSQTRGVSRKAESDSQRKELKKAMSSLDLAEGVGYIVRTAALDQTREELERDYRYLIRLFESIKALEQKSKAPALIYKESNLIIRSIRDYFTTDMDEVLIDDTQVFNEAKDFFQMVMPDQVKLVKLHQERRPIFSRYQIEDQIETLSRNKVALPSGGSIVIDPTEALVAIDVNSGKMASEQGVEATATKTNLEAAVEVGRQLRLRDLGGLIVIDFIDMRERKHMRQVEDQVKKALENDKARVSVGRISKFGLLEMSRQRIKATLTQGSHLPCPHCSGTGELKSPETQAVSLLRKIHASAAKGQVSRIDAQLPIEVAAYLLNNCREELVDMERRYQLQIHIHGNRDFLADQAEIEIQKKEKDKSVQPEFVAAGTLPMVVEEPPKKETEESGQPVADEAEAEPAKKRRRRRRRKPAGSGAAEEAQGTAAETTDSQESTPASENTAADETTAEAATESSDTEPPVKKPQRRRRSSRPKATNKETDATASGTSNPSAEESATADKVDETTSELSSSEPPAEKPQRRRRSSNRSKPTAEATAASADETATTATEEPATASTQNVTEEKPKRRRSSRKPKAAQEVKQSESADVTMVKDQSDTTTKPAEQPAAVEDVAAAEAKPKPKSPRRSTKKPAPAAGKVEDQVKEQASAEQAITEEKPKKPAPRKTATRSRKKSSEAPLQSEAATTGDIKPETIQAVQATGVGEEKPKRKRVSRAKPKPATVEAVAEPSESSETKGADKKPAKKTPVRRTTRTTPAKAAEIKSDAAKVKDKKAEPPEAEEPKPKRRRTVKKKPAEPEPSDKD